MSKINIYWFDKKEQHGNFGDELGPYIIKKLSGRKINQIIIPRTGIKLILAYIKGLFRGVYSITILPKIINNLMLNGNYIISVGSIIAWGNGKRKVWGSGILFKDDKIDNGQFYAVRGKYSQKRLKALGYKVPNSIGDPALILPLIYNPKITKSYDLGFIPHHTQYEYFAKYQDIHGIRVINLLDDIEKIIDITLSCKYIISSSLHGIIVAHAYNIPCLWYHYPKIEWYGENIKFLDYFSSVDIVEYDPFLLKEIEEFNVEEEINNIKNNEPIHSINGDLKKIQQNLIASAPFQVKKEYIK